MGWSWLLALKGGWIRLYPDRDESRQRRKQACFAQSKLKLENIILYHGEEEMNEFPSITLSLTLWKMLLEQGAQIWGHTWHCGAQCCHTTPLLQADAQWKGCGETPV